MISWTRWEHGVCAALCWIASRAELRRVLNCVAFWVALHAELHRVLSCVSCWIASRAELRCVLICMRAELRPCWIASRAELRCVLICIAHWVASRAKLRCVLSWVTSLWVVFCVVLSSYQFSANHLSLLQIVDDDWRAAWWPWAVSFYHVINKLFLPKFELQKLLLTRSG